MSVLAAPHDAFPASSLTNTTPHANDMGWDPEVC